MYKRQLHDRGLFLHARGRRAVLGLVEDALHLVGEGPHAGAQLRLHATRLFTVEGALQRVAELAAEALELFHQIGAGVGRFGRARRVFLDRDVDLQTLVLFQLVNNRVTHRLALLAVA